MKKYLLWAVNYYIANDDIIVEPVGVPIIHASDSSERVSQIVEECIVYSKQQACYSGEFYYE